MARKTTSRFIAEAKAVHGDKYDYSRVEYKSSETKVCIICPEHGEFWQTPHGHLKGHGCAKCGGVYMDIDYFKQKASQIHGDKYDYSKVEYKNSYSPVEIICKRHGSFWMRPSSHLSGYGCIKCGTIDSRGKRFGVGIDDVDAFMSNEKSHILWCHVLDRCYNPKSLRKARAYQDVTVCDEWLRFSNFLSWFESNKKWYYSGWHIDKDILVKGNKEYSPDKCCFVPQEINSLFVKMEKRRGEYPLGVSYIRSKKKFVATVAICGKNKTIGHFNTPEEAFNAYKEAKEARIKELADKWKDQLDPRVYEAMYNYKVEITD